MMDYKRLPLNYAYGCYFSPALEQPENGDEGLVAVLFCLFLSYKSLNKSEYIFFKLKVNTNGSHRILAAM